jgi:tetratricopeptide (TPR) repeat protein
LRAGDETGHALVLHWRGFARSIGGDLGGVEDMRDAAATLARHAHPKTSVVYFNLSESLAALGDLRQAALVQVEAAAWAERLGAVDYIEGGELGIADVAYEAGDWEQALGVVSSLVESPSRSRAAAARSYRGRIALARGDVLQARADAEELVATARHVGSDELLLPGLALSAAARHAAGETAAARAACDEAIARWHAIGGFGLHARVLAALAPILDDPGELAGVAALLPAATRWRSALMATAEGRHADAARLYDDIGTRPLETMAHLLAARAGGAVGTHHAVRAMELSRSMGATAWVLEAERLAAARA